jgi:hypothetical protein
MASVGGVVMLALVVWLAGLGTGGGDQAASPVAGQKAAGSALSAPTTATTASAAATVTTPGSTSAVTSGSATTASTSPTKSSSSRPTSSTSAASSAGSVARPAGGHLITIVNADTQTIWAATNPNAQHPIAQTGWRLDPGQSVTFAVPQGWGGRVWGRTGCSFSASGTGHCLSGDCGGVFQCRGYAPPPATLAELTLDSFDGLDFYDVSLVDGSNLPMYINTTHRVGPDPVSANGCYQGSCTKPIVCPAAMQVKAAGQVVACTTACAAFGGDAYCCTGQWAGRQNCDPAKWPVDYAKLVYKDAEPYAYSYAFDDSATMACKGDCDYRVVFGVTPGAR